MLLLLDHEVLLGVEHSLPVYIAITSQRYTKKVSLYHLHLESIPILRSTSPSTLPPLRRVSHSLEGVADGEV